MPASMLRVSVLYNDWNSQMVLEPQPVVVLYQKLQMVKLHIQEVKFLDIVF